LADAKKKLKKLYKFDYNQTPQLIMKNILSKILMLSVIALLSMSFLQSCTTRKIVSLKTLLIEMTNRKSISLYPSPWYNLKQFSSYDRKTDTVGGKGWFANDDYTQFLGVDSSVGRKEYILFDTDGPGAVVRWWMTFAGEGSYDGIVRIYLDNSENPVLEENVLKLLSGQLLAGEPLSSSVSPETELDKRGQNLYLPVPFAKHCRITYQCEAIRITANSRKPSIYYNICYRAYEKGTKVVSFTKNELDNAAELIKETNETLKSSGTGIPSEMIRTFISTESISGNDSVSVKINLKNSSISKITLKLTAFDTEYSLRSTVLKITFDGFQTVWVPAGEFFGTGYKKTISNTWNSRVNDQMKMESYWLMPFKKSCSVVLINYGDQAVNAELKVEVSEYKWGINSMYFGASWHEYHQILTAGAESVGGTGRHRDINFTNIKGKGVYAGDAVTVFNTVDAWWGEGDEKIFVDGELFPSSIGTGTEDYYGYAWCRPELFSHPFIAQPSGSGNFHPGLTINMRYRDLDAIPFKSSISSNIELWHWLPAVINYALTTYWYVLPPYEINIKADPVGVNKPIPLDPERPL
jgi:hypothetical protein